MLPMCTTTAYSRYMHRSCPCPLPPAFAFSFSSPAKSSRRGARNGARSRCSGNATNSSSFRNPPASP